MQNSPALSLVQGTGSSFLSDLFQTSGSHKNLYLIIENELNLEVRVIPEAQILVIKRCIFPGRHFRKANWQRGNRVMVPSSVNRTLSGTFSTSSHSRDSSGDEFLKGRLNLQHSYAFKSRPRAFFIDILHLSLSAI